MWLKRWSRWATLALLVVSLTAVAACGEGGGGAGSTSGGASSGSSTASASPELAAAKADVAKYIAAQPQPPVPALPSKPRSDVTVTVTSCELPVCKTAIDGFKQATAKLGWKTTELVSGLTPEQYVGVLNQIVQRPPQVLGLTPLVPDSFIEKQLAALHKAGTHIVEMAPPGTVPSAAGPVEGVVAGAPGFTEGGHLMGSTVVADAGGAAKTVFVWDPALAAIHGAVKDGYTKVVTGAGGSVDVLNVSSQQIGKALPTQVVSYLQAHPDVKYVAFALSDFATGVPQALKAAGLSDKVKIISRAPSATTMADIKSGAQWASVAEDVTTVGWRAVDLLARLEEGVDLGDLRNAVGWHQIFKAENVTDTTTTPQASDYESVFSSAWGLR